MRTKAHNRGTSVLPWALALVTLAAALLPANAAVLPEDRADLLYHRYDGGGVTVDGPSLLIRKSVGKNVSVSGNYYVDMVSSASIDVVTTASEYSEERREQSASVDYLHGGTIMSGSYTRSVESDYTANTASFGISQDFFGDLTTLSMNYSRGWDTVGKNGDPSFKEDVSRQDYSLGLSQVLTKNLLVNLSYEAISDEGFLNNPYRSYRYVDPNNPDEDLYAPERYPNTRTSQAAAVRGKYYLPWDAAVSAEYRIYGDTWGITANSAQVGYTHPFGDEWTFDFKYRYYTQDKADFYSDLFPRQDAQNFLARDKELSTFTSHTIGLGTKYRFFKKADGFFKEGSASLYVDFMNFDYDNFRDARKTAQYGAGNEPLYGFDAEVIRLFLSVWY